MAASINFSSLASSEFASQVDRNERMKQFWDYTDMVPPFSVFTSYGQFYNQQVISIDVPRQTSFTIFFVYEEEGTGESDSGNSKQIMITCKEEFFTDYTFTSDQVITMNVNFIAPVGGEYLNLAIDYDVINEYKIVRASDGEDLSPWIRGNEEGFLTDTIVFTGIELVDCIMKVKEVGWKINACDIDCVVREAVLGGEIEIPIIYVPDPDTLTQITPLDRLSLTNDPMVVVFDSDIKTANNMRYIYNFYDKNGVKIMQTKTYPDIENNYYGVYDMGLIYNNYTTTDPNTFDNYGFYLTDNVYDFYYTVGDNDAYLSGFTSDTKYCIKGASSYGNYYNEDDYIGDIGSNRKFLTTWEGEYLYRLDDYGSINFAKGHFGVTGSTITINSIVITKYGIGDQLGYDTYTDTSRVLFMNTTNLADDIVHNIPLAPKNLSLAFQNNQITDINGTIVTDNFIEDSDTRRYTIALANKSGTSVDIQSEIKVININKDESCWKYQPTTFLWKDDLGNYSSFTFNGKNIKEYKTEKNLVNKDYYSLIANQWTYNIGDKGRSNNDVRLSENHSVNSGWIDNDLSINISSLFYSNDVYIISNGNIYPVIITTDKLIEKNTKNDMLFSIKLDYQLAYDKNTNI